jgi:mRNA interferase RelE/StbE
MADTFQVQYSPAAKNDIVSFRKFDQRAVLEAVESYLMISPTQISRSRIKRMTEPFWSQYRLRVGEFRVYYDVDESQRTVDVLRVLKKGTSATPAREPS